jgi:hypothetical protein
MTLLWALTIGGLNLWRMEQRTWAHLGFMVPHGWRLWLPAAVILALVPL